MFTKSHAVFPTLTRVNKVSLATGTMPSNHGILFNTFYDPAVCSGPHHRYRGHGHRARGGFRRDIDSSRPPPSGRFCPASGRKLAVVHTGCPVHRGWSTTVGAQLGHCHFSIHGPQFSTPVDLATEVVDRLGAIPASRHPNLPRLDYAVTAFLEIIYPRTQPDVAILWLNEPDHTSHHYRAGCRRSGAKPSGESMTCSAASWTGGPRKAGGTECRSSPCPITAASPATRGWTSTAC